MSMRDFDSFSPFQLRMLKWMYAPSAILSTLASMCLLRLILFSKDALKQQQKTYHRVLLGISFIDILSSTALVVFPLLIYGPDLEPGRLCEIDGGIKIFGMGAPIYMACLSIYFLLIIRYSVPDRKIVTRYEIWFHLVSLLYPLIIIVWSLIDEAFNPLEFNLGCYIQEYPVGCLEDGSCERGEMASFLAIIGALLPFFTVLIVLVFSNVLIFLTVRKAEVRVRRYDFSNESVDSTDTTHQQTPQTAGLRRQSKTKRVAAQSFLFVLGFFLTYLPSVVMYIITALDPNGVQDAKYFVLQVMVGITWPLQGFFDFLIYVRPRYLQCRRYKSDLSRGRYFLAAAFSLEDFRNNRTTRTGRGRGVTNTVVIKRSEHKNDPKPMTVLDLEKPSRLPES